MSLLYWLNILQSHSLYIINLFLWIIIILQQERTKWMHKHSYSFPQNWEEDFNVFLCNVSYFWSCIFGKATCLHLKISYVKHFQQSSSCVWLKNFSFCMSSFDAWTVSVYVVVVVVLCVCFSPSKASKQNGWALLVE